MKKKEVVALMESSQSKREWNANADKVKEDCGGYPEFWRTAIVRSGLAARVRACWCGTDKD